MWLALVAIGLVCFSWGGFATMGVVFHRRLHSTMG